MEEVRVILSRGSDRSFRAAVFLRLAEKIVAPARNKTGGVAFINVDMDNTQITSDYLQAVKAIKQAILESRYRAARLVNKEVLALYYAIGGYISVRSRSAKWGTNAIGVISDLLQQELPGLRGFSETNIKRMRIFYEEWCGLFENRPLLVDDLTDTIIPMGNATQIIIRPLCNNVIQGLYLEDYLVDGNPQIISAGYYWWKKDLDKQCYLDEAVRYISVSETIINKRAQLIIQKIKEKL